MDFGRIRGALNSVQKLTEMRRQLSAAKAQVRSLALARASEKVPTFAPIPYVPSGPVVFGPAAAAAAPNFVPAAAAAPLGNLDEDYGFNAPLLSPSNAVNFFAAPAAAAAAAPAFNSFRTTKRRQMMSAAGRLVTALRKVPRVPNIPRLRSLVARLRALTAKVGNPQNLARMNELANQLSEQGKRVGGGRRTRRRKYRK